MRLSVAAAMLAGVMALGAAPQATAQSFPTPQRGPMAQQAVPLIKAGELKAMMKARKRFFLIDVRQPDEYAAGHIAGAVLMPLDRLPQTFRQIPKGVKLVVYCRSGHRSAEAASFLLAHGYRNTVSLDGGYTAWAGGR
jgi:rhodanese-related sulfurtransferase